jgi:hypothetical protein
MKITYKILILTIISGCASIMNVSTEHNSIIPHGYYDFSPPEIITSQDRITFLLINPTIKQSADRYYLIQNPFKTFTKNMGIDFEEMMVAKGMLIKGPYDSYENVVFSDKNEADLCFEPEVDLQFTGSALKEKFGVKNIYGQSISPSTYYYDGNMNLIGKLNLYIYEPHTKVKLWIKSVPLKSEEFYLKSKYRYNGSNIPLSDPGIWSTINETLNSMYRTALITSWRQLDMNELKLKVVEAKKIAEKAGYIKAR